MKKYTICIVLLSSIPFYGEQPLQRHPNLTQYSLTKSVPNMSSQHILTLYQLMKDTHEIFVKYNIEYWINGGTLLGAIRHQGQIPWDDDADWNIPLKQEQGFLALKSIFEELNYEIVPFYYGYKIQPQNGPIWNTKYPFRIPWIDIFFTVEKDSKIFYWKHWMKRNKQPIYITKNELYPIKLYNFGEIKLFGPNNPTPYLDCCYGNNWMTYAVKLNHLQGKAETIKLTEQDKVPAQPTGPLENRVQ